MSHWEEEQVRKGVLFVFVLTEVLCVNIKWETTTLHTGWPLCPCVELSPLTAQRIVHMNCGRKFLCSLRSLGWQLWPLTLEMLMAVPSLFHTWCCHNWFLWFSYLQKPLFVFWRENMARVVWVVRVVQCSQASDSQNLDLANQTLEETPQWGSCFVFLVFGF